MLTFSPEQINLLRQQEQQQAVAAVQQPILQQFPALFSMLPAALAMRLLDAKLAYAQQNYAIEAPDAQYAFLACCCRLNPRFDLHPTLHPRLMQREDDVVLVAWPDAIDPAIQAQLLAEHRRADWFAGLTLEQVDQIAIRSCWAVAEWLEKQGKPAVLPDEVALLQFIEQACELARSLKIEDTAGQVAFVVCQSLFGPEFYRQQSASWLWGVLNRGESLALVFEREFSIQL